MASTFSLSAVQCMEIVRKLSTKLNLRKCPTTKQSNIDDSPLSLRNLKILELITKLYVLIRCVSSLSSVKWHSSKKKCPNIFLDNVMDIFI